jgi:hypothetical protein
VLLDIHLPGMSGLDFLRLVQTSRIPVVAISGVVTEDQARECLRLGAIDFVQKPVPFEHLKEILACLEPLVGDEEPAGAEHREIRPRAPSARPARRHPGLVPDESPAAALQDRRAADPACAVLRAPAGRELLDGEPLSADSPAHRATRVAPDVIWSTVQGAGAMSSGGDAAAVSLKDTGGVTKPGSTGSHRPQGSPEGLRSACREC